MYQIADSQLSEIMDYSYCYSVSLEWNGPAFSWHDRSEFSTMVLVLVLVLQK